jgi:hypothetical protein
VAFDVAEALPQLFILAGLIVSLGIVYVSDKFVRALFGTIKGAVGWLPWLGHVITAPIEQIEQKLTNALGEAESKIDSAMGASFHKLASIVITTAELLIALPVFLYELGQLVGRLLRDSTTARHGIERAAGLATDAGKVAQHGIDRTRSLEQDLSRGIDAVGERVTGLEHEVADVLARDVAALRQRTREIEDGFGNAWELIRKHEEALGIGALTGAVALALEELDAQWVRCEANKALGKLVCGSGPALWEALLAGVLDELVVSDLCDFADGTIKLAESLRPVMLDFVDAEFALVGCHGATKPPPLKLTGYTPTPVIDAVAV